LACFVFVVRPKLLLFRRINFRKLYFYIDIGVKHVAARHAGRHAGGRLAWVQVLEFKPLKSTLFRV